MDHPLGGCEDAMTKPVVHTLLYGDSEGRLLVERECARVAAAGGRFAVRTYYQPLQNWFVEYTIWYSDKLPSEEKTP